MATLQQQLSNNPYGPYISSIISYFNDPATRNASPFQVLAAARLLTERSLSWGTGALPINKINPTVACQDACGKWYVHNGWYCPPEGFPAPCGVSSASIQPGSAETLIASLASVANVDNPYTPAVRNFQVELNGIDTKASNAWGFFQQIVDVFYENVNFIPYFLSKFENGLYGDAIIQMIGGGQNGFRPGFNSAGINLTTIAEGSDPATKATTRSFVGATGAPVGSGAEGPYFSVFSEATRERVFWFEINGDYIEPVLTPAPGTTITYHQVTLAASLPESDMALAVSIVIDATGFFDPVTIDLANEMIIRPLLVGSLPSGRNDYTAPAGTGTVGLPTAGKIFTYADGTSSVAHKEITAIDFYYVFPQKLIGTWFKLFNGTDAHLFYYAKEGTPIDPASFNVPYDFAYEILITDNIINNSYLTQKASESVIVSTGLFAVGQQEKCCSCTGCDNNGNSCCGDECCACPGNDCRTSVSSVNAISSLNGDGGTANIGGKTVQTELVAPNGTSFGTGYNTDREWEIGWNTEVVPYMKSLGIITHYLKSVMVYPCVCCIQGSTCSQLPNSCISLDCPDVDNPQSRMSMFLYTRYNSVTQDIRFNTPGVTFQANIDDCPTCLI